MSSNDDFPNMTRFLRKVCAHSGTLTQGSLGRVRRSRGCSEIADSTGRRPVILDVYGIFGFGPTEFLQPLPQFARTILASSRLTN